MKELRTALISDGVYEQSKEYALDAAVDIDAQLSDDDADQKSSSNAAQNKAAYLDFTNKVTECDGNEKGSSGSAVASRCNRFICFFQYAFRYTSFEPGGRGKAR